MHVYWVVSDQEGKSGQGNDHYYKEFLLTVQEMTEGRVDEQSDSSLQEVESVAEWENFLPLNIPSKHECIGRIEAESDIVRAASCTYKPLKGPMLNSQHLSFRNSPPSHRCWSD